MQAEKIVEIYSYGDWKKNSLHNVLCISFLIRLDFYNRILTESMFSLLNKTSNLMYIHGEKWVSSKFLILEFCNYVNKSDSAIHFAKVYGIRSTLVSNV